MMRITAFNFLVVSLSLSSLGFALVEFKRDSTSNDQQAAALPEDCIVSDNGDATCKSVDNQNSSIREATTNDDDDAYDFHDQEDDYQDDDDDDEVDYESKEEVTQTQKSATMPSAPLADCKDNHDLCSFWASSGECINNPKYMLKSCSKSCNNCNNQSPPVSQTPKQRRLLEINDLLTIVAQYGDPQKAEGKGKDSTMLVVRKTIDYMQNFIHAEKPTHRLTKEVIDACSNNHKLCAFWASIGECENNMSFMQTKCAPSCQSCANIDFDTRCPRRSEKASPSLLPGHLNRMFERIVANAPGNQTEETQLLAQQKQVQDDGVPYYTVHVHSRPESVSSITDVDHDIVSRKADLEEAPWVVTFDNFLTDEECDHLIELGHIGGYQRSKDVGIRTADGSYSGKVSTTRTSENAWCSGKTGCRDDAIATRVRDRISNVTQIPSQNFEDYQMLKYEKEQFYQLHHDYIPHQRERACGPRILTFFLYLSDVEEGGGTGLDQINGGLVVNPKKGKALLWPSVLNYDPSEKDGRTTHEAIAVKEGTKFAANTWIHLYDVIESQKRGCT